MENSQLKNYRALRDPVRRRLAGANPASRSARGGHRHPAAAQPRKARSVTLIKKAAVKRNENAHAKDGIPMDLPKCRE
jgi:hypothetical protein